MRQTKSRTTVFPQQKPLFASRKQQKQLTVLIKPETFTTRFVFKMQDFFYKQEALFKATLFH